MLVSLTKDLVMRTRELASSGSKRGGGHGNDSGDDNAPITMGRTATVGGGGILGGRDTSRGER
jgi:hypothetical protein